jgi:hypothetical protein
MNLNQTIPWSAWVVAAAILVALNEYGAFLTLILISPWIAMNNYVWQWFPAVTVSTANAMGVKPQYVWVGIAVLGIGILFAGLALRKPRNRFYKHAAILMLGFLVAATISVKRLSGWAGV